MFIRGFCIHGQQGFINWLWWGGTLYKDWGPCRDVILNGCGCPKRSWGPVWRRNRGGYPSVITADGSGSVVTTTREAFIGVSLDGTVSVGTAFDCTASGSAVASWVDVGTSSFLGHLKGCPIHMSHCWTTYLDISLWDFCFLFFFSTAVGDLL